MAKKGTSASPTKRGGAIVNQPKQTVFVSKSGIVRSYPTPPKPEKK